MIAPVTHWISRPRPWVEAISRRVEDLHNAADDDGQVMEAQEIITALQEEGHDLQALKDLLLETFVIWEKVTPTLLEEDVEVSQ